MYINKNIIDFKLIPGLDRTEKNPVLSIMQRTHYRKKENPLLWIGENDKHSHAKYCFGYLTDKSELRKLANAILDAIRK